MFCSLMLLACLSAGPNVSASHFVAQDAPLEWNPAGSFWRNIAATVITTDNFGNPRPVYRTEVRSRWTAENLYFHFTCRYEELYLHSDPSRATETNKLWDWGVAEVFIGSDANIRHYHEFEMSPQGEWLDLDIDRSPPEANGWKWHSGFEVTASIDNKNKIWYGVMRIPYRSIDSRAAVSGNLLRVNFSREQGPPPRRVEIAWRPTMQRAFHVPERFGTLKLTQ